VTHPAVVWWRLFPSEAGRALLENTATPQDHEAMWAAIVQGRMKGCMGAENWGDWMTVNYPEGPRGRG
jgi:hypothetical protein